MELATSDSEIQSASMKILKRVLGSEIHDNQGLMTEYFAITHFEAFEYREHEHQEVANT